MVKSKKFTLLVISAVIIFTIVFLFSLNINSAESQNYNVDYSIQNDWGNGAVVNVVINNTGKTSIKGWNLEWNYEGDQVITNMWSASFEQIGKSVIVGNDNYNSVISANGSVNFGFQLTYSENNDIPASFVLNTISESELPPTETPTVTITPTEISSETSMPSTDKLCALSFDDGPSATTSLVLDKLEKYKVTASFFLVGQNITKETIPIIERTISLGCDIENHSLTHSDMSQMTSEQIINEIEKTNSAIGNAVGVRPKFFRPPYISVSNTMYDAIDLPFICGVGCNDWVASVSAETRANTILNTVKDGDIILLHDFYGNTLTVEALDSIIPGLMEKGFSFVTVNELFEQKGVNPEVEYKIWTNVNN